MENNSTSKHDSILTSRDDYTAGNIWCECQVVTFSFKEFHQETVNMISNINSMTFSIYKIQIDA
jgi:hypothetical protein